MPWTDVLASEDLGPGEVATIKLESLDVVVWRSAAGAIAACDARCPHQWAHLGSAGVVDGDELVCLSHAWRFDLSGDGWKAAASGRRDPKSPVATFSVREIDGRIEVDLAGGVVAVEVRRS